MINIGYINYLNNNYDEAYSYTIKGIRLFKKFKYYTNYPEAFMILALIDWKTDKLTDAEKKFRKSLDLADKYNVYYSKLDTLKEYYIFLFKNNRYEEAIPLLELALSISKKNNLYYRMAGFCSSLSKVYDMMLNKEKSYHYLKLYNQFIEKHELHLILRRAESLKSKNKLDEIKLEKDTLQSTMENVFLINELGKNITSTLELDKIVDLLINTIKKFMEANTFGIGFYDNNNKIINYSHFVEDGVKISLSPKSLYDKNSLGAFCLRNNELVIINDFSKDYIKYIINAKEINYYGRNYTINSVIYAPLIVNDNLIGIITLQSHKKNAFTESNIEVIKTLLPYASIALNNSIKSKELKKEIKIRKKAESKLRLANKTLDYLSKYDSLTNIPNRRNFDNLLKYHCINSIKYKETISLILIDIDYFKEYNDNYGHIEGDNCIQAVAQNLNNSLIKNYVAARYGGDEFAIILPDTNSQQAYEFGENLREIIEKLKIVHEYSKVAKYVTITMGIASLVPSKNFNMCNFIKNADEALYVAKNNGRNKIAVYSK